MALINFKAEKMSQSEEFEYRPGTYEATVQAMLNGKTSNGNEYWEVVFKGAFTTIHHRMFDTGYGRQDLYKLFESVGIDTSAEVDSDELQGRVCMIKIEETDPYNGKRQWRVTDIFACTSEDDDNEEEDDIDLPFGDDEDDDW